MNATSTATPPVNPWLTHLARIQDIKQEVPGIATYQLAFEDSQLATRFRFRPGQFNMLYLPGFGEAAISISSDPGRRGPLLHTVRVAGNVTRSLCSPSGRRPDCLTRPLRLGLAGRSVSRPGRRDRLRRRRAWPRSGR